jgi:hypothetical protein
MTSDDWIDAMMPAVKIEVLVGDRVWVELPGCPGCCASAYNADDAFSRLGEAMTRFYNMEVGARRALPAIADLPRLARYWRDATAAFEKRHAKQVPA